jgi:tetratricopeptide (TPR) repeat protein
MIWGIEDTHIHIPEARGPLMRRIAGSRRAAESPTVAASAELDSTVVASRATSGPRKRTGSRWRAATLGLVYVLMAVHVVHWKLAGRTLAPLELNEVMYTLELGIVTAGFVFMIAAILSTAIFGRFFCSWGCHVLALQDLSAWLLARIGIRPRPVRARVLLLVPVGVMLYMFAWPQVTRVLDGQPMPRWRVLGDEAGWASFVTSDFARNLPGPGITILTALVCGVGIVWILGSRSFCSYACPYGAVFALADRVAPGRIVARGDCSRCGACTAACSSHVRVHEELAAFGRVVDPACLKDLDCVRACENDVIHFGFARPSLFASWRRHPGVRKTYDFTLAEEALLIVAFGATLAIFRGLYDSIPLFVTLAMGALLGTAAVVAWRLASRENVRAFSADLRVRGRLTKSGAAFAGVSGLVALAVAHSGWIRYHQVAGRDALHACEASVLSGHAVDPPALAGAAAHLETCLRWGVFASPRLERDLASVTALGGDLEGTERHLRRALEGDPRDLDARLALGRLLLDSRRLDDAEGELQAVLAAASGQGRDDARRVRARTAAHETLAHVAGARGDGDRVVAECEAALREDPTSEGAHLELGLALADKGDAAGAIEHLREAVRLRPDAPLPRYDLAFCLAAAGDESAAIDEYREVLAREPRNADAQENLGLLLANRGDFDGAARAFEAAIEIRPDFAAPRFNLGRVYLARGRRDEAHRRFEAAAALSDEYAALVSEMKRRGEW